MNSRLHARAGLLLYKRPRFSFNKKVGGPQRHYHRANKMYGLTERQIVGSPPCFGIVLFLFTVPYVGMMASIGAQLKTGLVRVWSPAVV
jgi:hypothetical protein